MSKTTLSLAALCAAAALALGACTSKPLLNVTDAPVTVSGKSADQVKSAIVRAGTQLGWQIVEVKPGMLMGTLKLREHVAVVDIPYSSSKYSILFKSGVNIGEKDGQIHRNYNGWVQNLDRGIQSQLAL